MDCNDINEVSKNVDQAIKCAKKRLHRRGLIIQQKQKKDTIFHEDIPRKKYKPLDQRKRKHYYSGRVGKKAEMMRQFYKAKLFIEKEADERMVQEEVAPFEPEVDNFANAITIKNEDKEDLKIMLGLPMKIEKILQHPTEWLDDRIINHAQELIKRKYKDTDGLQDPVLRRFATVDGKFAQALHVNNDHKICGAGNKNNEVTVYDSMGGNLSKDTVHVIARMVKCEGEELMVKLMPVQHQTNGNDCGLFTLALATDFAEGIDPSERYYDEKALRNHLLQCFRNNEINQFLQEDISVKSKTF